MNSNKRKCTMGITLALIGTVSMSCDEAEAGYQHVYKSQEDCLAENPPEECEPCKEGSPYYGMPGYYHGPFMYTVPVYTSGYRSRSVATTPTTRSGFGYSGSSRSSSSGS